MLVYYCPKCQRQNPENVCGGCGRNLPSTALRNIWSVTRLPSLDAFRVGAALRALLFSLLVLLAAMLLMEYLLPDNQALALLTNGELLPVLMQVFVAGTTLVFFVLVLQGRETVQCVLDPKGVLKRTWIQPTRLCCWARFLRFDPEAIQLNTEGVPFLLAHEEYLAWRDVCRLKFRRRAGRIGLYRPYAFLFIGIPVPREEYDAAVRMIAAKVKKR